MTIKRVILSDKDKIYEVKREMTTKWEMEISSHD